MVPDPRTGDIKRPVTQPSPGQSVVRQTTAQLMSGDDDQRPIPTDTCLTDQSWSWVGSIHELGWVGLGFEKVTHDQLCDRYGCVVS